MAVIACAERVLIGSDCFITSLFDPIATRGMWPSSDVISVGCCSVIAELINPCECVSVSAACGL